MLINIQHLKIKSKSRATSTTFFILALCFNISFGQLTKTYTTSLDRTSYVRQVMELDTEMGVKFINPNKVKGLIGSVKLEMHATNGRMSNYICELLNKSLKVIPILDDDLGSLPYFNPLSKPIPPKILLFKTTINTQSWKNRQYNPQEIIEGEGGPGTIYRTMYYKSCIDMKNQDLFTRDTDYKSNDVGNFTKNNIYTWNIALNHFGDEKLLKLYEYYVPVTVTLTFTGYYTLDDISEIIFPGLTLSPEDFDTELFFNNDEYYWSKSEDAGDPSQISMILENNELEIRGNATTPLSDDTGVEEVTMEVWGKFLAHNNDGTSPAINEDFKHSLWIQDHLVTEAFIIQPKENWADYVFNDTYKLLSLKDLKTYIKTYKHLPNIPTIKDLENNGGYTQHDLNVKLLEKIEQLTLYKIQQAKKISDLETNINQARQAIVAYKTPH